MQNIALNTFKEIIRNKYLYIIIFFSFVFIVFSVLLGKLTIWQNDKIIVDFWLAMIEVFWLLWVLFVWSQLLFNEIEGKTIFLILSKPVKRYEFLLGKILGFSLTIFLIILLESILFIWVLVYQWVSIENLIIWSLINTFLKLEITLAIVFFLSTFMSNMLTIAATLMIYVLAHSYSIILDLVYNSSNAILINITKIWWLFFPPFEALNTKDVIWTFSDFSLGFLFSNGFYGIVYFAILVFFSILIFNRKRFE
jgi:ABC-type transport system involved in multi-copper enzyme maturation permease subunit